MLQLQKVHHIAIICKDYQVSRNFYTNILGLTVLHEAYRKERDSWKLDLAIGNNYVIELFSFPNPPSRASRPEALGLRHLAFQVDDLEAAIKILNHNQVATEPIRVDEFTGKRFTFFEDPDHLPLELYENK